MIGFDRTVHDVQDRSSGWIKHAADHPSLQSEAAVRWALSRLDDANVPEVVHGVVVTLTGNRKAAKQARKAAVKAVHRAERKLRRLHHGNGRGWLVAGILAAAVAVAVLTWRALVFGGEPEVAQAGEDPQMPLTSPPERSDTAP